MLDFARLPKGERDDAVTVVALGMDTHPAIVEKDFWVCWMLRYLFDESCFGDHFAPSAPPSSKSSRSASTAGATARACAPAFPAWRR